MELKGSSVFEIDITPFFIIDVCSNFKELKPQGRKADYCSIYYFSFVDTSIRSIILRGKVGREGDCRLGCTASIILQS